MAKLKLNLNPKRVYLNLPTDIDPEQEMYVEIRPATQRDHEKRASLNSDFRQSQDEDGQIVMEYRIEYEKQRRIEVYLTLADCNIEVPDPFDETGEKFVPLFRFRKEQGRMVLAMTEAEFNTAWGNLPQEVARSIHAAVLKVNPEWEPGFRSSTSD